MKRFLVPVLVLLVTFSVGVGTFTAHAKKGSEKEKTEETRQAEARFNSKSHHSVGSTLEVHINPNGKVLVRGAKVTAVSGSIITATTMFGGYTMTWTINTDSNTRFVRKQGSTSGISEIAVGDFLSFTGTFNTTASTPTVQADIVRNWSVERNNVVVSGRVGNVNVSARTFTLTPNSPCRDTGPTAPQCSAPLPITVSVPADADILIKVGDLGVGTMTSLESATKVTVKGTFGSNRTLTAKTVVITEGV